MLSAFACYKNTEILHAIFVVNAARSVPALACCIICFSMAQWYLDDKHNKARERADEIKRTAKDAKLQLLTHMDPLVVETLREIVKADMK